MIVTNLMGGLGNTLFQIAASIGAAEFYGTDWKIQGNWKYRKFFKNIPQEKYIDEYALPEYKEPHFHYSVIPQGHWHLIGYFQSEKYFSHCKELVKKMFTLKEQKPIKGCAIHVRGGDYLTLKDYHYNLTSDYYTDAVIKVQEETGINQFIVFTDDPKHAMTVLPKMYKWEFLHTGHEVTDLLAMSRFENLIIANSSFSWWGAWLGAQKSVYAPGVWFGEKKKHYITTDLCCDGWNIIEHKSKNLILT